MRLCERQNSTTTLPPCSTTHRAQQSERSWKRNKFASSPSLPPSLPPSPVAPSRSRYQSPHSAGTHFHPLSLVCSAGWLVASWLAGWEVKCFLARDRFGDRVMQGGLQYLIREQEQEPFHGKEGSV